MGPSLGVVIVEWTFHVGRSFEDDKEVGVGSGKVESIGVKMTT